MCTHCCRMAHLFTPINLTSHLKQILGLNNWMATWTTCTSVGWEINILKTSMGCPTMKSGLSVCHVFTNIFTDINTKEEHTITDKWESKNKEEERQAYTYIYIYVYVYMYMCIRSPQSKFEWSEACNCFLLWNYPASAGQRHWRAARNVEASAYKSLRHGQRKLKMADTARRWCRKSAMLAETEKLEMFCHRILARTTWPACDSIAAPWTKAEHLWSHGLTMSIGLVLLQEQASFSTKQNSFDSQFCLDNPQEKRHLDTQRGKRQQRGGVGGIGKITICM
jgi:hypothetical protein